MIPEDFLDDETADRDQERETHIAGIIARAAEAGGLIHPTDDFSFEWHTMFDAEIEAALANQVASGESAASDGTGAGESGVADLGADFNLGSGGDLGAF